MISFVCEFVENRELYHQLWRSYMNNLLENCDEILNKLFLLVKLNSLTGNFQAAASY